MLNAKHILLVLPFSVLMLASPAEADPPTKPTVFLDAPSVGVLSELPKAEPLAKIEVSKPTASASSTGGSCSQSDILAKESGGRYNAVSKSGKYRGAYQFDQRTWESNGGTGDPAAASPAEQDRVFQNTYAARGGAPWNCR